MLQLLLGEAGTGKTTAVLESIRRRAQEEKYSFLLGPEQFSAAVEGMLCRQLGDRLSAFVTSCSFRTLGERILDRYGGGDLPLMSDAGRAVLVRRALEALDPAEVSAFGGQRRSAAFCAACAQAIQELKTAGVTPDFLAGAGAQQPRLAQLASIYRGYEALLAGVALDPSDQLSVAAGRLQREFFEGRTVFLDGFDGFTAPQYQILRAMLASGADVVVSLCCPGLSGGEQLFRPAQETACRLTRLASEYGVPVKVRQLEEDRRHRPGSGMALFTAALGQGMPLEQAPEDVWLTPCSQPWQEAKLAAALLAQKAREGIPYSRMAVVCRDKQPYAAAMRRECRLAGLSLFEDEAITLQFSAPAAALRAAVRIARRGLNTQDLLALLKTGLVEGITDYQIAMLENYTQVWRMTAADWRAPLPADRTLDGYDGRPEDPRAQRELAAAEKARAAAAQPAERLYQKTAAGRTAAGMPGGDCCEALYQLLEEIGAAGCVARMARELEDNGDPAAAEEQRRMWDAAMQLLDELYRLLQAEQITLAELDELLGIMLRSTELGRIPQTLEAVLFTTADRLRAGQIECCVVLGAAEGQFPQLVGASGLLTHADRELLKAAGASMPGEFEQRVLQEELYFYRTATAACRETFFFYWENGGENRPSPALCQLQENVKLNCFTPGKWQMCPTPEAALDWLCGRGGEEWADRLPDLADQLGKLEKKSGPAVYSIQDSAALEQLLGSDLTISPSRMERFYRCRLAYFLEHIARLRAVRPAKLDMRLGGALIHYILENALQDPDFHRWVELRREGQTDAGRDQLEQLALRLAEAYPETLPGAGAGRPQTRREENTLHRIAKSIAPLLEFLLQEQAVSQFVPWQYELPLGPREQLQGLSVPLPGGHTARLTGKIDRVDAMDAPDGRRWLRVVDYKTGGKDFSLDNVFYGLDAQMLLYLFSLCPPVGERFADSSLPAGVVYLLADPARKAMKRQEALEDAPPAYQLHGLVADEPEVWNGMDPKKTGKYLPFTRKKDGSPDARSVSKRANRQKLLRICTHLQNKLQQMGGELYAGQIDATPLRSTGFDPCDYCEYGDLCRRLAEDEAETVARGAGEAFNDPEQEEDNE